MSRPDFAGSVRFVDAPGLQYRFDPDGSWEVFVQGHGYRWVHELEPGDTVGDPLAPCAEGLVVDRVVHDDAEAVLES